MADKIKEILLLKNLKRVGKSAIYGKYWDLLNNAKDVDDLILKIGQKESKFSKEDLLKAKNDAEELHDYILNSDIQVITVFDNEYPEKLDVMGNKRPLILYIKGNAEALTKPNISVIGTRKPSQLSQEFEKNLVKSIVNNSQRVVVSGLALGCDKIAHQTTVEEGKITIAVLPSGVNVIKPTSNKNLAQNIIKTGGCLVSEYEPNKDVNQGSYVERDKIVAAFSDAIFVVECGVKSGTMKTVKAAYDYQKTIYSYLPDEKSDGSYDGNEFILSEFDNSIRVENIEDFINDLNTIKSEKQPKVSTPTLDDFLS